MTEPRVDLHDFFAPSGVALIGKVDRTLDEATLRHTHDERWGADNWHLVNPKGGAIGSIPIHRRVADIDAPLTLAVLSTPASTCPALVRECGAAGVRFALIFSSGFSETGDDGTALEAALAAAGREAGVRLVGPNTNTNAFERFEDPGPRHGGRVCVVTQSGHNGRPIVQGIDLGLRVSRLVPTGNEVDIDAADVIEHAAADADTDVIAAYVEGFRDGPRLHRALTATIDRDTPVVMLKVGATEAGARMARSHTGHLVGSDAIVQAILDRYGVARVGDLDELLETTMLFAKLPGATGPRVALYSISGGSGALMAEVAEQHGVPIPELSATTQAALRGHLPGDLTVSNPVDNGGTFVLQASVDARHEVMSTILDDPAVDVLVIGVTGAVPPMTDLLAADVEALRRTASKPIVATWNSPRTDDAAYRTLVESGVPLFRSFRGCFAALAAFAASQRARAASRTRRPPRAVPALDAGTRHPDAILDHFGIRRLRSRVVDTVDGAVRAATELGEPVVMKIETAHIDHKSDLGLVRLGVTIASAADEYRSLMRAAERAVPQATIDGVLVQPMVAGIEMIVGVVRDPVLGPAVVVGAGGIFAETLADRAVRPLPIDRRDATEMIQELRVNEILRGARGTAPSDVDALADVLERVGALAESLGEELRELDLNPVIVHARGDGASVVDALILLDPDAQKDDDGR